jgi:hypothetical protein
LVQPLKLSDVEHDDPDLYTSLIEAQGLDEGGLRQVLGLNSFEECPTVNDYVSHRLSGFVPALAEEFLSEIRRGFNELLPIESVRTAVEPDDLRRIVLAADRLGLLLSAYNDSTIDAVSTSTAVLVRECPEMLTSPTSRGLALRILAQGQRQTGEFREMISELSTAVSA